MAPIIRTGVIAIQRHPFPSEGRWSPGVLESFADQQVMLRMLSEADPKDALGAALAYLLNVADRQPHLLRAVLRTSVDNGQTSSDIIDLLSRVSGKG